MREEKALADLAVRETLRGELGDLQLLRGQLIARLRVPGVGCARRTPAARAAPGRPRARIRAHRRCRARRAGPHAIRRSVAAGAATGRKRAGAARAGTATASRSLASASSKRSPASAAPRAGRARDGDRARSRYPAGRRRLASTCASRARAASSSSMWHAASARSAISHDADQRVIGRVARLEQAVRGCIRVAVASAASAAKTLPNCANAIVMFAPTGSARASARAAISSAVCSSPRIAATSEVRRVRPQLPHCGSRELLGQTPRLIGSGDRRLPVADTRSYARVKKQQPRHEAEPALGPQTVDRRRQQVAAEIECADASAAGPRKRAASMSTPRSFAGVLQARRTAAASPSGSEYAWIANDAGVFGIRDRPSADTA